MAVFIHPDKISNYLLKIDHPHGQAKARFFLGLGFDIKRPEVFRASLHRHFATARLIKQEPHVDGILSVHECDLATPLGPRCIRSVWLTDGRNDTRLITAYPFL